MNGRQPSALASLRALFPLAPAREKRRFAGLLGLSLFMAFSELALTGLVALLAAIFGSPEAVLNNNPVRWLRENLGINFGNDPRLLALAALSGIFLAIAFKNGLLLFQQQQMTAFSETIGAASRLRIFRFYQRAPYLWILHNGVADLGFGLTAANMLHTPLLALLQIFFNFLLLATLLAGLISVSPLPSLLLILLLGLGGTLLVRLSRRTLDAASQATYATDQVTNEVGHLALHGLKEMRLYAREKPLFQAFSAQLDRNIRARIRQATLVRLPVAGLETLGFCTLVLVLLFLIFIQNAGMARISGIMGFMAAAAWRGLPVANRLVEGLNQLRAYLPYMKKVRELLDQEQTLRDTLLVLPETLPPPLPFARRIELEGVTFTYPQAKTSALTDISLSIKAGSMTGIVGLSGAGKSTLVNILAGLLPPDAGRILVDGEAVVRDNASAWLRRIGYVAQAPYILDATLAENVALSRWGEDINRERVLECCRMAALDFVADLEKGMDTVLGDRGTRLSGVQAQRVTIARALYSEPDMIIFDEATSSLDLKNEKAIHETILSLRKQVTVVIIAHRLSTVEGCDALIWLDKGRVRGAGKVEEVLPEYAAELKRTSKTPRPNMN
jgi:ABC-type multidrug transport system fused ATPase/permease subunit